MHNVLKDDVNAYQVSKVMVFSNVKRKVSMVFMFALYTLLHICFIYWYQEMSNFILCNFASVILLDEKLMNRRNFK